MNCHNNNENNKKGMLKHGFMMMLCCLLPVILIAGIPLFGFKSLALSGLASLLCPIMMIGMMFMMGKSHRKGGDNSADKSSVKNENQDYITVAKEDYEVLDKNK